MIIENRQRVTYTFYNMSEYLKYLYYNDPFQNNNPCFIGFNDFNFDDEIDDFD